MITLNWDVYQMEMYHDNTVQMQRRHTRLPFQHSLDLPWEIMQHVVSHMLVHAWQMISTFQIFHLLEGMQKNERVSERESERERNIALDIASTLRVSLCETREII